MKESRPDWYERLKAGPFRERTFTEENMREVGRIARGGGRSKRGNGWLYAASSLAVVCVLTLVLRGVGPFGTGPALSQPTDTPGVTPQPTEIVGPTEGPQPIDGVYYVRGKTGAYAEPDALTMFEPEFIVEPGVPLTVMDSSGGFLLIEQGGDQGWVNGWYLTPDKDERSVIAVEPYLMLAGKTAALRAIPQEAGTSGMEVGDGKVVRVMKEYLDWVCVDIVTYDQPYGGEFWVPKAELEAWNPNSAREGIIRQGTIVRGGEGLQIELPGYTSVHVEETSDDGRYRIGAAGGFSGYIEARDFVPNPFLSESEWRRQLLSVMTERWLLTAEEALNYEQFAASKEEELLRGLSPADIFRYYVQAEENGDYETVYALLIQDPDYGVPDRDTYMRDLAIDPEVMHRTWQMWGRLKLDYRLSEEIEQAEKDHALIRIIPMTGGTPEEERGFQIIRNKAGIWKAAWMPMQ